MRIDPYLNFDGQCAEAFAVHQRVLGGKIEAMMPSGATGLSTFAWWWANG
jgi:uncharacterized glyoxalase superfamily protein PhnB